MRERPVVHGDQLLWPSLPAAMTYAEARCFMYHSRQRVRPVTLDGVTLFRVSKAVRHA